MPISQEFIDTCDIVAGAGGFPLDTQLSDLSFAEDNASDSSVSTSELSDWDWESTKYYAGLPSNPLLVYRTGSKPWKQPDGPEAYTELKELRAVFGHKIITVWDDLGPKVVARMDSLHAKFTSIDCVRFAMVLGDGKAGPVVLWIGVVPKSLSQDDARIAGQGCLALLKEFDITDVEVEFRESIYTKSVGRKLLHPESFIPTVDMRGHLTPALGLQIAGRRTPWAEGMGGFYFAEGGESTKVFLVTARHVLFPPNVKANDNYDRRTDTRAPWRPVLLLGTKAFDHFVTSIKSRIAEHAYMADIYKRELGRLKKIAARESKGKNEEKAVVEAKECIPRVQHQLDRAIQSMNDLDAFHDEVTRFWGHESLRILGDVAVSPPITLGAGSEGFTEDYAVVELASSKFDEKTFEGNVIDLYSGDEYSMGKFSGKMNPRTRMSFDVESDGFEYPCTHLFKLQDHIPEEEMHHPNLLDQRGDECLWVIKGGKAGDVTVGCATGVFSYVREYSKDGRHKTSKEWAILPYDQKSGAFSGPGDSGAVIVDGRGRFGGLLTGGSGKTAEDLDITYATPFYWLWERIKENGFPNAHLEPVMS